MRTLVINLTRFGDLLQTQPALSGLAAQGHEVGLVCLGNFAEAAGLLRDVDRVLPFPAARLLARLDADWRQAVLGFRDFVAEARERFAPQQVVNLTPSVSARLLARALGGETLGFGIDEQGFNADASSWAAFLQIASASRGASPFNVADLFRRSAGLGREGNGFALAAVPAEARARARSLLDPAALPEARGFTAVQLGASEDKRRWPVAHFAGLARLLWERERRVPVLVGAAGEAGLGERFSAAAPGLPVVNLLGRTALPELAAVLSCCDLLATNDTGTMHLAAGLGVPVLAVFLATAQPWDTGPCREGCVCLEPDLPCHPCGFHRECAHDLRCRTAVTPEAAFGFASRLLAGHGAWPEAASGTRAWLTRRDGEGFMDLAGLSGHEDSDRVRWIRVQRHIYRRFLDGGDMEEGAASPAGPGQAFAAPLARVLAEAADLLHLLAQQGGLLCRAPRPALKAKFLANWQRLSDALQAEDGLCVLGLLWAFESQQRGRDMGALLSLIGRYQSLVAALRGILSAGTELEYGSAGPIPRENRTPT